MSAMVLPANWSAYLSRMSWTAVCGTAKITISPDIGPGGSSLRM
jgi:hypothetical protein